MGAIKAGSFANACPIPGGDTFRDNGELEVS